MMKRITFSLALLTCFAFAGVANATLITTITQVDPGAALAGHVSNDITITTDLQYSGSQLLLNLTAGTIYQDTFGTNTPPNAAFFTTFPALEFDTFFANGSLVFGGAFGEPSLGGGAVDIGGAAGASITSTSINQSWNDPPGAPDVVNVADFPTARITLSDDAQGTWSYLGSDGVFDLPFGNVIDGEMIVIPEPATLLLFGIGLIGVTCGRRFK